MKKFIISAISLAILLMAFACAEPSSTSDAGNSNNTPATPTNNTPESPTETSIGLPMSFVGTWTLFQFTDGYINMAKDIGLSLNIIIKEDNTIWYQGTKKEEGATYDIDLTQFGEVILYSPDSKTLKIDTTYRQYEWTYSGNSSSLEITGTFFVDSPKYSFESSKMIIRK